MKILSSIDSFKGSISSQLANQIVKDSLPQHEVTVFPISDGGEGLVEAFINLEEGEKIVQKMTNVNGHLTQGHWGWIEKEQTAVIEAAEGAGLVYANSETLHPKNHTSYGMGEQILQALDKGATTLILGLGGTATIDGGMGMLQALGCVFYNQNKKALPILPISLENVESINLTGLDSRLNQVSIIVASDVINPLCGKNGAVHIFGEQKGLPLNEMASYDQEMNHYRKVVEKTTGKIKANYPGAGAAGGIGFALLSFFDCLFKSGINVLAERGKLEEKIKASDIVITGEGKFDLQSFQGKVPVGISRIASKYRVPTILFVGKVENHLVDVPKENIVAIIPIVDSPMSLKEAMDKGPYLLEKSIKRSFRLIDLKQ
ncbi:MAG: glycerate kinase [Carnobacterium sp.]|nr:glycerate kinase [Carnobacterium sp.]